MKKSAQSSVATIEPIETHAHGNGGNGTGAAVADSPADRAWFWRLCRPCEMEIMRWAGIERGECGVLLMCYSLERPVRRKLAEALRSYCPGSRIVAITNDPLEEPDFADSFVYGLERPEALIEAINAAAEKVRSAEA